jgi:FkbM family methyltransferase
MMHDPLMLSAVRLVQRHASTRPVMVDVGAYDGSHSLMFRAAFPDAVNVLVEPERPNPRGVMASWHWVQCAAGRDNGVMTWNKSDKTHPGSGSILSPVEHIASIYPGMSFEVEQRPVRRLDSILAELHVGSVDLLWMDVQGAELEVIAGLGNAIHRVKVIATEVHAGEYKGAPTAESIVQALPSFRLVSAIDAGHLLLESIQ